MIKAIFLLKRKPGVTHEQFREHYENSHVMLARKYIGHLLIRYTRNYVSEARRSRAYEREASDWDYDCITEWVLRDEQALDEVFRIFKDPEIGKLFTDDEEFFLDRESLVSITCKDGDIVNTGTGGGHGYLERGR